MILIQCKQLSFIYNLHSTIKSSLTDLFCYLKATALGTLHLLLTFNHLFKVHRHYWKIRT